MTAILLGLTACTAFDAPPVVHADSGWRTASGIQLSIGEVEALRGSCRPQPVSRPIDTADFVANPVRDNPVYHPGGEGYANAPMTGIAAGDRPLELGFRRTSYAASRIDDCLIEKGLVPVEVGRKTATLR